MKKSILISTIFSFVFLFAIAASAQTNTNSDDNQVKKVEKTKPVTKKADAKQSTATKDAKKEEVSPKK